jgi:hypothetical protein
VRSRQSAKEPGSLSGAAILIASATLCCAMTRTGGVPAYAARRSAAGESEDRPTVYVAIDWTGYLDQPSRRLWLIRELQAALERLPKERLDDVRFALVTPSGPAAWSRDDIRDGRWPSPMPKHHRTETLRSLDAALTAAGKTGRSTRLVFLVWKPDLTMPGAPEQPDAALLERARRARIRVIQYDEARLPFFEKLAAEDYYNFPYNNQGPPRLVLSLPDTSP